MVMHTDAPSGDAGDESITGRAGTSSPEDAGHAQRTPTQEALMRSAERWDSLATAERTLHRETGGSFGLLAKADLYERAARSLRLEIETGRAHCACCLRPDKWHGVKV